jgi:hypothetical protein
MIRVECLFKLQSCRVDRLDQPWDHQEVEGGWTRQVKEDQQEQEGGGGGVGLAGLNTPREGFLG